MLTLFHNTRFKKVFAYLQAYKNHLFNLCKQEQKKNFFLNSFQNLNVCSLNLMANNFFLLLCLTLYFLGHLTINYILPIAVELPV